MPSRKKDRGLGRGLSALMNDLGATDDEAPLETKSGPPDPLGAPARALVDDRRDDPAPSAASISSVSIDRLQRNPDQPRRLFDRNKLDDLIASIQQRGVLQPILVRPLEGSRNFMIVAGERRYQAALKANLTQLPVIIRDLSDRDVLEIGIIENVQRADLNPMEEALAYERLINDFGRTQADIATTIGKSRAHVANTVRLTGLSERARELLMEGKLTAGHARAVLAAKDSDALTEAIVANGMSVREAEAWVKGDQVAKKRRTRAEKPSDIVALEQKIRDRTGFAADIRHIGKGGEIRLKYKDLDDMEALLKRLGSA